ncbi:putative tail fiber assembly protein [Erwinia amylovora Ea644]|nr:putative tail fiber assembly protein [Erwinia amylovora Ea644]
MNFKYSPSTNGFYGSDFDYGDNMPKDAFDITVEHYNYLMNGQSNGKIITPSGSELPILTDPVVDYISEADVRKKTLMDEISQKISVLQDAVELDMATEEEKDRLLEWKKYRVRLNRVYTSKAPDIEWPVIS